METEDIKLTSAEISALWSTYIQSSAINCFYKHFLEYLKAEDIKPIIEEALALNNGYLTEVEKIFTEEDFPLPKGFSNKNIDLSAPALYTDLYALSFVYRSGQMVMIYFARLLGQVARKDVYKFIENCMNTTIILYEKSLDMMLVKGGYNRPIKIDYPTSIEFVQKEPSLLTN